MEKNIGTELPMCTLKISWIHRKLAKLIGFREKSWVTGRLSLYILMYFMNHGNVLFTGSIDSRRKGGREESQERERD